MNRKLELTDKELQELDLGIKQTLANSRVELHHTRGFPYKDCIKRAHALLEQILAKVEAAIERQRTRLPKR